MAEHRPLSRRARHRRDGCARATARLLLRRHRRRGLEDDGRGDQLAADDGRPGGHRFRGRRRGRRLRPQRRLRGDGRELHSRQRLPRRRGLQVRGRGQDVEERRPQGHAADRARARASLESRPRVRGRARPHLRPQPGARRLPLEGRRCELAEGAVRGRQDGGGGPRDGSHEPPRALRGFLAGAPHALEPGERGPGQRPLEVRGRGRQLDEAHGRRPAQGRLGADRRDGVARQPQPGVGDHRGAGRRSLPLRRRGQDLEEDERRAQAPAARLVLHAHPRRPQERGVRLRPERGILPLAGRGQDLQHDPGAPRGQPRSLDRAGRPRADDRGQRRGGQRQLRRGRHLVHDLQPAHRAVLPRHDRRPLPLLRLRRAAGQLDGGDREPQPRAGPRRHGLVRGGRVRERLHRTQAQGPGRRLRGLLRRVHQHATTTRRASSAPSPSGRRTRWGGERRG